MATTATAMEEVTGLGKRAVEYLFISTVGAVLTMVTIALFSTPSFMMIAYQNGLNSTSIYLAILSVFGFGIYASQAIVQGEWVADQEDIEDIDRLSAVIAAVTYYNLMAVAAAFGGLVLIHFGYPLLGVGFALLLGPADITMAQEANASPLTLLVATCLAIGYTIGALTSTEGGTQPRTIADVSILANLRRNFRRRNGGLFG